MLKTAITASALAMLVSAPAWSQAVCSERSKFLEHLKKGFQETPVAMGLASNGGVIEILTSENGTWTILITLTDGRTCAVATGEGWEELPKKVALGPAT